MQSSVNHLTHRNGRSVISPLVSQGLSWSFLSRMKNCSFVKLFYVLNSSVLNGHQQHLNSGHVILWSAGSEAGKLYYVCCHGPHPSLLGQDGQVGHHAGRPHDGDGLPLPHCCGLHGH